MNIYVSNLGFNVEDADLKELFGSFGAVSSVKVITDRETGRSRGFAFVEMEDEAAGENAISQLNNSNFSGRTISVAVARPKEDKKSFSGGFNKRSW